MLLQHFFKIETCYEVFLEMHLKFKKPKKSIENESIPKILNKILSRSQKKSPTWRTYVFAYKI